MILTENPTIHFTALGDQELAQNLTRTTESLELLTNAQAKLLFEFLDACKRDGDVVEVKMPYEHPSRHLTSFLVGGSLRLGRWQTKHRYYKVNVSALTMRIAAKALDMVTIGIASDLLNLVGPKVFAKLNVDLGEYCIARTLEDFGKESSIPNATSISKRLEGRKCKFPDENCVLRRRTGRSGATKSKLPAVLNQLQSKGIKVP